LLPIHHPLESWRDTAPRPGVRGLGQPVMQPVFESRPLGDLLIDSASKVGARLPWSDTAAAVKAEWLVLGSNAKPKSKSSPQDSGSGQDDFWTTARREGGLFDSVKASDVRPRLESLTKPKPSPAAPKTVFLAYPHIFLGDGRGADKPWLQEMPEPLSQIVWDSWAAIHPDTANELGVKRDAVISIRSEHGIVQAPAYVTPTVHRGVIAMPFGQGHRAYGRYAKDRGANPWAILAPGAFSIAVEAKATGDMRRLVTPTSSENGMMGRSIVEAISIEDLARGVFPAQEPLAPEPYEMYAPFQYPKHKWGMTIDVNACIGCSACVAACYAENNVPVVGQEVVSQGRVMSWIRIERFFPSPQEQPAPQLFLTPMMCQQCDHAPCEPVCPVFASYHTNEGLNGQIYNRCVGTRYCENNCPYKVRRFNFYLPEWPEPLNLQLNPDVTVRGAGVMEKCTFCVQRIQYAELNALTEGRPVRDGEIVPACAQACPTRAITFGDIKDPQ
ncbi:MAG TPA: 4Fe-4S dicluster domain-containing protein, partial [Candidatus Binataceae bacterium]